MSLFILNGRKARGYLTNFQNLFKRTLQQEKSGRILTESNVQKMNFPHHWSENNIYRPIPQRVTCGELRASHAGRIVEIVGRVQQQRFGRFVQLKDGHGATQLVVPEERQDISKRFTNMPLQSFVSIVGWVMLRPSGAMNQKLPTGDVEVKVEDFVMVEVNRNGPWASQSRINRNALSARSMSTQAASPKHLTTEEYTKCGSNSELLQRFRERKETCGGLGIEDAGRPVTLIGWAASQRLPRFLQLKDGYGSIQCILSTVKPKLSIDAKRITGESIVQICGIVTLRPDSQVNMQIETGSVEVAVDTIKVFDPNDQSSAEPVKEVIAIPNTASSGINSHNWRSHTCGELRKENTGERATLFGWLQHRRMGRFLTLRDAYGVIQCVIPEQLTSTLTNIDSVPLESVVQISGMVGARPPASVNLGMETGEVEILVDDLKVLNQATHTPFPIKSFQKPKEQLRLEHRYLDIRTPDMQSNLRMRSSMLMNMRKYLIDSHQFVEVETPTLFCRTPGGAKEFVVPTRHKGKFYSLVQSPQQFKQMLMAGAIDRYFQVARCYRDESTRVDRQPEFTQLDIELSFAGVEEVLALIEGLLRAAWPRPLPSTAFERLSYRQALRTYGTDKPDNSYDLKIQDLTDEMRNNEKIKNSSQPDFGCFAIVHRESKSSNSFRKSLQSIAKEKHPDVTLIVSVVSGSVEEWCRSKLNIVLGETQLRNIAAKLKLSEDHSVILAFGPEDDTCWCLGEARSKLALDLESRNELNRIQTGEKSPLWIMDFPLFLKGDDGSIETCHHPFTAPHPEDYHLLETDPFKVRSLAYDLVLDGNEVGGGSVRAHSGELQLQLLKLLKLSPEPLQHLINALQSGCPPHAGIALGIDRLVTIACKADSIRDVIAFPKNHDGCDPLSGAPNLLSHEEQKYYHISVLGDTPNISKENSKEK